MIISALIVFVALNSVIFEVASVQTFTAKQSEQWDAYIQSLKDAHNEKRELGHEQALTWYSHAKDCKDQDLLKKRDGLGRRNMSKLLKCVQNQGFCGNCWAFAAVHALTDYLSIEASNTMSNNELMNMAPDLYSAAYLTLCDKDRATVGTNNDDGNGCCGAKLHAGPKYITTEGIVTDECVPYIEENYNDKTTLHTNNETQCPMHCSSAEADGSVSNTDINDVLTSERETTMDICYKVLYGDEAIHNELHTGNVVLAGMEVNNEFINCYECGVYQQVNMQLPAMKHAVEIVDEGTLNDTQLTEFWVVKNSWGMSMHENGYFRIKKGQLKIGHNGWAISFYRKSNATMECDSSAVNFDACGPAVVSNPSRNMLVNCSVDHVLDELKENNAMNICCSGIAGAITYNNLMIKHAEATVTSGHVVDFRATVAVLGCNNKTSIDISAMVTVDNENNTFTLIDHSLDINKRCSKSKGLFCKLWIIMLLAFLSVIYIIVAEW